MPALADAARAVGTRTWLDLPEGFVPAAEFTGFQMDEPRATVAVAELPSSFVDAYNTYTDSGLARKRVTVTARESFELDGLRAVLIEGVQPIGRRDVHKLIMLTGDLDDTLIITATYFADDARVHRAPLMNALRNTHWQPSLPLDLYDGLAFRLKDVPGLRIATRANNNVVFTDTGQLPDQFYTGHMLVAGWSDVDKALADDALAVAQQQFRAMSMVNTGIIDDVVYKRVNDRQAIETVGHGVHKHLGYDVSVYQVLVVYPSRYFLIQGLADRSDEKEAFDRFDSVVGTLTADGP
ncbi:MAG: hypothetical protein AAFU65_06115 [Pseudomonadota bacterium]